MRYLTAAVVLAIAALARADEKTDFFEKQIRPLRRRHDGPVADEDRGVLCLGGDHVRGSRSGVKRVDGKAGRIEGRSHTRACAHERLYLNTSIL